MQVSARKVKIVKRGGARLLAAALQPRRFQLRDNRARLYKRVSRSISRGVSPSTVFVNPDTGFGLDRTVRGVGAGAMGALLWPLGLSRGQLEYLSDRTIEAATGQNIRLYEAKW
jgi:hypothetical protein